MTDVLRLVMFAPFRRWLLDVIANDIKEIMAI